MYKTRSASLRLCTPLVLTLLASATGCTGRSDDGRDPLDAGDASPPDADASCNKGPFEKETGPISSCSVDWCAATVSFGLDSLRYGLTTSGFNLDGLNNSTATSGATVAGCGQLDGSGGLDRALNEAAASLAPLVDIGHALADLAQPLPGEAAAPERAVWVQLFDLAATSDDPCVGGRLLVRPSGLDPLVSVDLHGALVGDVLELRTDTPLAVPVPIPRPEGACGAVPCAVPASLPVTLRGVRMHLLLSADHTRILPGSSLGGYLFVGDCAGGTVGTDGLCAGGSYADANATSLTAMLTALAGAGPIDATDAQMTLDVLRAQSDLHMEPDGTLSPCSGPSNASVNANAVSWVLDIGGSR